MTYEDNLVTNDMIRTAAYFLWEEAGRPIGRDLEFWTKAEEKLAYDFHSLFFDIFGIRL
jgi:hypothetical protein